MVMEYMARGSLFDILRNKAPLSPRRRLDMAKDVAIGLSCLHLANPPILHHDLKSLNLLVDKDWKVRHITIQDRLFEYFFSVIVTSCCS